MFNPAERRASATWLKSSPRQQYYAATSGTLRSAPSPTRCKHFCQCVRMHMRCRRPDICTHGWMSYVDQFMLHYTRRPGLGLRPPSPAEAEEADKEVLGEIFRMIFHDNVSIDDAVQSVVREDLLRVKLMPQPKPLKAPLPPALPSGLRPSGNGQARQRKEAPEPRKRYKKGSCWGFQDGSSSGAAVISVGPPEGGRRLQGLSCSGLLW